MNIFEVFTVPEIRTDVAGEYRYVCIGAWSSLTAKNSGAGIKAIVDGVERTAELFNDFKVYYATTGSRIIRRIRNDQREYLRTDGRWVRWDRVTVIDEALGWQRENVTRDASAEIQQAIDRYLTRASNKGYRGDMRGTTLNLQVAASNQDANEGDGGAGFTSTALTVTMNSNTSASFRSNGGFFFSGATIAAGSTINTATLTMDVTAFDDPNCDILFNDVDSAANFGAEADVTSRARTTATAAWVASNIGAGVRTSPDFASVLQEVIDRAGWASGNNLCALVDGRADTSSGFSCDAYDTDTTNACKLDIDYTAPAAGGQPAVKRMGGVRFAHNLGYGVW